MKKIITLFLTLVCVVDLTCCGNNETYKIKITVPAGSTDTFVYSDEEISATGNKITIWSVDGLGDTEVILSPVNENVETGYVATYLTSGMPVEFDGVKGEWFKIGISMQNDTDTDKTVYIEVEGVEVNSEHVKETEKAESEVKEPLTKETMEETSEGTVDSLAIDIQGMLETAEEEAFALHKKLSEDPSLKQSDMNELSHEIYQIWDDLLNELWAVLNNTLDEKTMHNLLEEQRAWITMKETEVKQASEAYTGGSMAPLVSNQKAAELTKERVYELADYLGF